MRAFPSALLQASPAAGPLGLVLVAIYAVIWEKTGFELSEPVLMIVFAAFTSVQAWAASLLKAKLAAARVAPAEVSGPDA
jgi:hypothetical protein